MVHAPSWRACLPPAGERVPSREHVQILSRPPASHGVDEGGDAVWMLASAAGEPRAREPLLTETWDHVGDSKRVRLKGLGNVCTSKRALMATGIHTFGVRT